MRSAVKTAEESGLPTVAECGGFLYLGQTLEGADGKTYPMAGFLPGRKRQNCPHLVRFGYAALTANADSMLFAAGETLPIHEFHHWDSTANGTDFVRCQNQRSAAGPAASPTHICMRAFRTCTGRAHPCRNAL